MSHLVIGGLDRNSGRAVAAAAASRDSTTRTAAANSRVWDRCEASSAVFRGGALPGVALVEGAAGAMS